MAKNPRVKKAHEEVEYTQDQVRELMKCAQDPIYFIEKYVRVQHPTRGSIPLVLYDYQKTMIMNFMNHRNNIVLSARQTGKTTVSAIYLLWYALFHDDKLILIVSNKNTNAMEMVGRMRYAYEELPFWLKPGVNDDGWNKHSIRFDNNSRIESQATSENSGRGMAISLLYCDEFAFVRPSIQELFWTSISPTLATGGACIISSTPNGDSDLFANMWRKAVAGIGDFKSLHVRWDEPPGRDEEFKRNEIAKIGELKWLQEYECMFVSSEGLLISSIILNQLNTVVSLPDPNSHGFRFWSQPERNKTYLIGVDPSTGSGQDMASFEIFEYPSLKQIGELRTNSMSSPELYLKLKWVLKLLARNESQAYFTIENNGIGEGMISLYQADENPPPGEFVSESGANRYGMRTDHRTKLKMCMMLKNFLTAGKIQIFSADLLHELKNFSRNGNTYKALTGATDDSISAVFMVFRIIEDMASYENTAYNMMYTVNEAEWFSTDPETDEVFDEYDEGDEGLPVLI